MNVCGPVDMGVATVVKKHGCDHCKLAITMIHAHAGVDVIYVREMRVFSV